MTIIATPQKPKSNVIEPVKSTEVTNLRVLLIGYPHAGKTFAALSFPDPYVIDFDNKLPLNTANFPFHNEEWVRTTFPQQDHRMGCNRRDAFLSFLRSQMNNYTGHTLILDSWTLCMATYSAWARQNPGQFMSKEGNVDPRKIFLDKLEYSVEVVTLLSGHKGHVVVTAHASPERDEKGKVTGTFRPFTTGQFRDIMSGFFNTALLVQYKQEWERTYPSTLGHTFAVKPSMTFKPMLPPGAPTPTVDQIPATYKDLQQLLTTK